MPQWTFYAGTQKKQEKRSKIKTLLFREGRKYTQLFIEAQLAKGAKKPFKVKLIRAKAAEKRLANAAQKLGRQQIEIKKINEILKIKRAQSKQFIRPPKDLRESIKSLETRREKLRLVPVKYVKVEPRRINIAIPSKDAQGFRAWLLDTLKKRIPKQGTVTVEVAPVSEMKKAVLVQTVPGNWVSSEVECG